MKLTSRSKALLTLAAIVILGLIAVSYLVIPHSTPSASSSATITSSTSGTALVLLRTISLQGTQGRIDHMAVDLQKGVLYVAAYGNNSVGVVDINSGQLVKSISGLNSPQGVVFAPDSAKLYVSNAGDGTLSVFETRNFTLLAKISFPGGDADNLRFDSVNKLLYVGYGSGGIAKLDTATDKILQEYPLPGHPESFQIQARGQLILVNVPTANIVEVINGSSGLSVYNYTLKANSANYPMALDEAHARLFIATRSPSQLLVFDTSTPFLRSVANMTIAGDPDDIFYDLAHGLIYVSCGQGSLVAVKQADLDHYNLAQTVSTGTGARTSLLVPELGSIFVAVPASASQQAKILVYAVGSASTTQTSSTSLTTSKSSVITSAPIPTSASLSVTPPSGPSGLYVTLAGSGYVPGVTYQVCLGGFGNTTCGFIYTSTDYLTSIEEFASLGNFTANSAGSIPAGTKVMIPDLFGRSYLIGVVPYGKSVFFVSTPFKVETPTLSVGVVTVVAGASVTLTGSGYAPSTTYTACNVPVGTYDCGYIGDREETPPGYQIGTFTTDALGNIPPGTTVNIPRQPGGQYAIGIFVISGGYILISEVEFTVTDAP
jgi:DNA-binding beta-propeller fold protein YncE